MQNGFSGIGGLLECDVASIEPIRAAFKKDKNRGRSGAQSALAWAFPENLPDSYS